MVFLDAKNNGAFQNREAILERVNHLQATLNLQKT